MLEEKQDDKEVDEELRRLAAGESFDPF